MKLNLDGLRAEIEEYLHSKGFVVFQSLPRFSEMGAMVYWDAHRYPDFKAFLAAAEAAGVRLITLFARELEDATIDDALSQLEEAVLDREERRTIESRLKGMRGYTGFTCQIQLAFDLAARIYVFDLRTDWFNDLNEIIGRVEESYDEDEDENGDFPLGGGYFPKN
ncbi:MAG TPA: hypothetical protein VKV74_10715 [Bryobacteraceae bacterium]|nr:hypothetical protein [Bryobacteraceae bacterium]